MGEMKLVIFLAIIGCAFAAPYMGGQQYGGKGQYGPANGVRQPPGYYPGQQHHHRGHCGGQGYHPGTYGPVGPQPHYHPHPQQYGPANGVRQPNYPGPYVGGQKGYSPGPYQKGYGQKGQYGKMM